MSVIEHFRQGAFSAEDLSLLSRAYTQALSLLGTEGISEPDKAQLAKHLMEVARGGEVDEQRLSSLAVLRVLARSPVEQQATVAN